ncbi:trypsin-7-like [Nasonia vitripennis]|uniref:Peptidase S1 domain-containing protein n=1 Tax=Nasonia vitripennis TaxID=7425 RepID=A0A7M7Q6P7_NASVI|nr:trypsin-7-like [Nasonia vitripennis]
MSRLLVLLLLLGSGLGYRLAHPEARRFKSMRIIDGEPADIRDYPYLVSLQYNGSFYGHDFDHFCCGSILNENWIITSAQCAQARQADSFQVRLGSAEYYRSGAVYRIDSVVLHPKFNELSRDYDVGLIKVTEKIVFGEGIQPIGLPKPDDVVPIDANFSIAGWGATELLGKFSDNLLKSHIQKISRESCQSVYGIETVTSRMFCVFAAGFGPCVGDSGSPAVYRNMLVGKSTRLASWSYNCAYQYPTVYARVSSVLDWIEDITA